MLKPFNPRVFQLNHVAMGVTDIERSVAHYAEVVGLRETARDDGSAYLSIGSEHHNIVLRRAEEKAFLHLGYQLNAGTNLDALMRDLLDFGLEPELKSDSQPGISRLVEVVGPGGHLFQFFSEVAPVATRGRPVGIAPLRLGHVAVLTAEAGKLRMFYEDFLGFHYTDDLGGVATFLTCNRDHHVVNIVGVPESRIHHIAFELHGNSEHARACDLLASARVPTLWGPARHYAGHNLASYHHDPDRVMIEFYTDMDIYVPGAGIFEPRPWHEYNPQVPMSWAAGKMTNWETAYGFTLRTG